MNTDKTDRTDTSLKKKLTLETMTLEDLDRFPTVNAMLDELYGKEGIPTREAFDREAYAYYNRVISEPEEEEEETVDEAELEKARSIMEGFMKDEYVEEPEEEETMSENGIRHTDRKKELVKE